MLWGCWLSSAVWVQELESFVDKQLFLIQDQEKDQLVPVGFNLDQFQVTCTHQSGRACKGIHMQNDRELQ